MTAGSTISLASARTVVRLHPNAWRLLADLYTRHRVATVAIPQWLHLIGTNEDALKDLQRHALTDLVLGDGGHDLVLTSKGLHWTAAVVLPVSRFLADVGNAGQRGMTVAAATRVASTDLIDRVCRLGLVHADYGELGHVDLEQPAVRIRLTPVGVDRLPGN